MDRRTQKNQATPQGDSATQPGSGADACPPSPPPSGATLIAGRALVQTVRHFFPDFNRWLDQLPDSRDQDAIIYPRRFLGWWGIALYLLQLGSRRQLDYELRDGGPQVLNNLNRLAETRPAALPGLPDATPRQADALLSSRPGSQAAGARRGCGVAGQ
jgi:hypothetical protein